MYVWCCIVRMRVNWDGVTWWITHRWCRYDADTACSVDVETSLRIKTTTINQKTIKILLLTSLLFSFSFIFGLEFVANMPSLIFTLFFCLPVCQELVRVERSEVRWANAPRMLEEAGFSHWLICEFLVQLLLSIFVDMANARVLQFRFSHSPFCSRLKLHKTLGR